MAYAQELLQFYMIIYQEKKWVYFIVLVFHLHTYVVGASIIGICVDLSDPL